MAKDVQIIIEEITDHLINYCSGGNYSDYYVGITKNVGDRLFSDHRVPIENHCWIWREANNDTEAREVEKHFLDKGMKGGGGGGDKESVFVYVYKISRITVESVSYN